MIWAHMKLPDVRCAVGDQRLSSNQIVALPLAEMVRIPVNVENVEVCWAFCTYVLYYKVAYSMGFDDTSTTVSSRCWDELFIYTFLPASKHILVARDEGISKIDFPSLKVTTLKDVLSFWIVRARVTLMMLDGIVFVRMFRRLKHLFGVEQSRYKHSTFNVTGKGLLSGHMMSRQRRGSKTRLGTERIPQNKNSDRIKKLYHHSGTSNRHSSSSAIKHRRLQDKLA